MIVTQENQRLYLSTWEYNVSRILTELAKIVTDNGGRVKPLKNAIINDRNTDDEPILVTHTNYINFVFDDFYYYYQIDGNPFFEFYYRKAFIKNGCYSRNVYLMEDKKDWLHDCFFQRDCSSGDSSGDITEAAISIFNMLVQAKPSQIHRESKRKRVANIYDNGYHYETITTAEQFQKIDF